MSGIRDQHEIDELRKRLYARGPEEVELARRTLRDEAPAVNTDWVVKEPKSQDSPVEQTPQRRYRKIVFFGSIILFLVLAGISAALLFWDGNKISGENINFSVNAPVTIGGSETMRFQIGITNQNAVGVESAVLIMKYPDGSRTVEGEIKNVFEERIEVGSIAPGEVKNIPLQVGIFGKENDEKQLEATLEYRVQGTDSLFYKTIEPHRFRITSSPVTLQVTSLGRVAAGQEVEIVLAAKSNSSRPLKDVLLSASYPNGFSYRDSSPKPIYNQNTWKIDELLPEQTTEIRIKGVITGLTEQRFVVNFNAGVAEADNQFIVSSLLAEAQSEFFIERPFIDVAISVNGLAGESMVLDRSQPTLIDVVVKNTLRESVYDMVVEVVPGGNALNSNSISSENGFYDSNKKVIRWEVSNNPDFAQVNSNEERRLQFDVQPPESGQIAAGFDMTVNVYAKRIAEVSAQEQLIGTVTAEAKYSSEAFMTGQINFLAGPVPPQVGETTSYFVTLVAEASTNDLANVTVNTSLPTYVSWQGEYSGPGTLEYNPISKQLEWKAGDIRAGTKKELVFSIDFLPSLSQAGITPILVNRQTLRAVDKFTNTPVTTIGSQLLATLSAAAGYDGSSGVVTP